MYNDNVSRRRAPRSWFQTSGARNALAASALIAALSGGATYAAQVKLAGVAAAGAPARSISRAPRLSGADRTLSLIRSYAGHMNVASDPSLSWADTSGKPVVWYTVVGNFSSVNSYDADGRLVGSLTGLTQPLGVALDKSGNLYVANTGAQQVLIYKKGATKPTLTLEDKGFSPVSVAIDEADGSVAVANACNTGCNSGSGNTVIYKKGATKPSMTLGGFSLPEAVAFDARGKLWVTGYSSAGPVVGYYGPGYKTFKVLKIPLNEPSAMQFDRMGNLDIVDDYVTTCPKNPGAVCSVLYVYKPDQAVLLTSFVVGEAASDLVSGIALDKATNTLWAADEYTFYGFGFLYTYPAGKQLIHHTIVFSVEAGVPYGVAVQP